MHAWHLVWRAAIMELNKSLTKYCRSLSIGSPGRSAQKKIGVPLWLVLDTVPLPFALHLFHVFASLTILDRHLRDIKAWCILRHPTFFPKTLWIAASVSRLVHSMTFQAFQPGYWLSTRSLFVRSWKPGAKALTMGEGLRCLFLAYVVQYLQLLKSVPKMEVTHSQLI